MATILVVDDERNTRESIDTILTREGHDVASIASAEAALDHLAAYEVDLILRRFPGKNLPVWLVFLAIFRVVAAGHSGAMPQPLRLEHGQKSVAIR